MSTPQPRRAEPHRFTFGILGNSRSVRYSFLVIHHCDTLVLICSVLQETKTLRTLGAMDARHFIVDGRTWMVAAENFKDEISVWEWDKTSGAIHKATTKMPVPFVASVDVSIIGRSPKEQRFASRPHNLAQLQNKPTRFNFLLHRSRFLQQLL